VDRDDTRGLVIGTALVALMLLIGVVWYARSRASVDVGGPFDGGVFGLSMRA
jgi:hypothetical protein